MEISKDIFFHENLSGVLAYNFKWNKACIVDKDIYNYLKENQCDKLLSILSEDMLNMLINNGILIDDYQNYKNKKYIIPTHTESSLNTVYLHVTQRCNLHCSYCYDAKNLGQKDELSFTEIQRLAEQLKRENLQHVVLTRGEPLLRKDIFDIGMLFKSLGFKVGILSNGSLIKQNLNLLNEIDYAIISLDTLDRLDNVRNGLDIELLVDDLKSLPLKIRKKIALRSVIGKNNLTSWREVKELASDLDIPFTSSIRLPNSLKEVKDMPELGWKQIKAKRSVLYGERCGACDSIIAVNANGDVYPCQALIDKDMLITNIKKHNWMQEFYNSNITKKFLNWNIDKTDACKDCELKYLCGGGCRAISYNLFGDTYAYNEYMCPYLKADVYQRIDGVIEQYS